MSSTVPAPVSPSPEPSVAEDWGRIKQGFTTTVGISAALALVFPPASSALLSDDETMNFVVAVVVSWPLILGIAVWGIVLLRSSFMNAYAAILWTGVVAAVSTWLSANLSGVPLPVHSTGGSGPAAVLGLVVSTIAAYFEVYEAWLFFTAVIAGVALIYLWVTVAERRLGIS